MSYLYTPFSSLSKLDLHLGRLVQEMIGQQGSAKERLIILPKYFQTRSDRVNLDLNKYNILS